MLSSSVHYYVSRKLPCFHWTYGIIGEMKHSLLREIISIRNFLIVSCHLQGVQDTENSQKHLLRNTFCQIKSKDFMVAIVSLSRHKTKVTNQPTSQQINKFICIWFEALVSARSLPFISKIAFVQCSLPLNPSSITVPDPSHRPGSPTSFCAHKSAGGCILNSICLFVFVLRPLLISCHVCCMNLHHETLSMHSSTDHLYAEAVCAQCEKSQRTLFFMFYLSGKLPGG